MIESGLRYSCGFGTLFAMRNPCPHDTTWWWSQTSEMMDHISNNNKNSKWWWLIKWLKNWNDYADFYAVDTLIRDIDWCQSFSPPPITEQNIPSVMNQIDSTIGSVFRWIFDTFFFLTVLCILIVLKRGWRDDVRRGEARDFFNPLNHNPSRQVPTWSYSSLSLSPFHSILTNPFVFLLQWRKMSLLLPSDHSFSFIIHFSHLFTHHPSSLLLLPFIRSISTHKSIHSFCSPWFICLRKLINIVLHRLPFRSSFSKSSSSPIHSRGCLSSFHCIHSDI